MKTRIADEIAEFINFPGLLVPDLEDITKLMSGAASAAFGSGSAAGTNRAKSAVEQALTILQFEGVNLANAHCVLVTISSNGSLRLEECREVANSVHLANEGVTMILGVSNNEGLQDELRVSIVATGLDSKLNSEVQPNDKPPTIY